MFIEHTHVHWVRAFLHIIFCVFSFSLSLSLPRILRKPKLSIKPAFSSLSFCLYTCFRTLLFTIMAEKAIYDMEVHGSMDHWIRVGDKTMKEFIRSKGLNHVLEQWCTTSIERMERPLRIAKKWGISLLLTEDSMATWEDTRKDIILHNIYPRKSQWKWIHGSHVAYESSKYGRHSPIWM